jgi:hypothetical protein
MLRAFSGPPRAPVPIEKSAKNQQKNSKESAKINTKNHKMQTSALRIFFRLQASFSKKGYFTLQPCKTIDFFLKDPLARFA